MLKDVYVSLNATCRGSKMCWWLLLITIHVGETSILVSSFNHPHSEIRQHLSACPLLFIGHSGCQVRRAVGLRNTHVSQWTIDLGGGWEGGRRSVCSSLTRSLEKYQQWMGEFFLILPRKTICFPSVKVPVFVFNLFPQKSGLSPLKCAGPNCPNTCRE